jgi:hypothetical protein
LGAGENLTSYNLYAYCGNDPVGNWSQKSTANAGFYSAGSLGGNSSANNGSGNPKVNWSNGGFQFPIWISSLLSGSDFGSAIAPALRTLYQYIKYPGVRDLNKLYGLDYVPGTLNSVCSAVGYGLIVVNIALSAWSNFTNDELTTKQQWISFGVDTAYTGASFGIGLGVGALVSLIPVAGPFLAPFASAGVTYFIDWTNEQWGWLDETKQWLNDL